MDSNGLAEAEAKPGGFLNWVQNCFEQMPTGQSQAPSWPSFAIWLLSPRLPANYGLHGRVPPDAKWIVAKLTESLHRIKASKPVSVDTWRDCYQESMKISYHTTRLHHSAALMALAHLSRWDVQKFVATSAWRSSKNVRHDIYQAFAQRLLRLLLLPRPPRITSLVRRIENIPSKNS